MERRTAAVAAIVLLGLGGLAVGGLTGGVSLQEQWVSDTPRENQRNHHAVGLGPNGTVVAPVAAVAGTGDIGPTSCALVRIDPEDGSVRWRAGVEPANCTTHALTEPAFGDVDGDGGTEVLSGTTERVLRAHDAATGDEEWRVPLDTYGYGRPAVANLTARPGPEVVASDIRGHVVAVDDGTVLWRYDLGEFVWAPPRVADLDRDGAPEVLIGGQQNVTLLSATGDVEWKSPTPGGSTAIGTVDGRSRVFAADTGRVIAFDGATGDRAWRRDIEGTPSVHVADEDRLYVGVSGGEVLALDTRTGVVEWRYTFAETGRHPTPPPSLGDVDGDGDAEVVAADNTGAVALLDARSGEQLSTYSRDVPVFTFPTVGDVDGDDADEVLVRYGDGRVVALEAE